MEVKLNRPLQRDVFEREMDDLHAELQALHKDILTAFDELRASFRCHRIRLDQVSKGRLDPEQQRQETREQATNWSDAYMNSQQAFEDRILAIIAREHTWQLSCLGFLLLAVVVSAGSLWQAGLL